MLFPALVAAAALGVSQLPGIWRALRERSPRAALAIAGVAIAFWVANANVLGVHDYRIPQIDFNIGMLEAEAGNRREAMQRFHSALARAPWDTDASLQLARLLLAERCYDEADKVLQGASANGAADASRVLAEARIAVNRLRQSGSGPAGTCQLPPGQRRDRADRPTSTGAPS